MPTLNKIQIIGNVSQKRVNETPNGAKIATVTVVTNFEFLNAKKEKQDIAEYHNVIFWNGLADIAEKYLEKGNKVYIEGRNQTRSYEKDGQKFYRTEVIAEKMILLGYKEETKHNNASDDIAIEDIPF